MLNKISFIYDHLVRELGNQVKWQVAKIDRGLAIEIIAMVWLVRDLRLVSCGEVVLLEETLSHELMAIQGTVPYARMNKTFNVNENTMFAKALNCHQQQGIDK